MTRRATVVAVAAMIAAACGNDAAIAPPLVTSTLTASEARPSETATPPPDPGPSTAVSPLPAVRVEQVDCPGEMERGDGLELSCGVVTVPIDRVDGSIGSTRITIATLTGYDAGFETPVAVLQGGPGGASSGFGGWFPQQPFTQVFVDQRGVGFMGPDFDCTEIEEVLGLMLRSPSVEAGELADNAYDDCARRLDQDVVLRHTDTSAHAADVVDVMTALGYGRWVAYGVSYGSTIGFELLREEPQGLAGVVLDGVYPPDLDTDAGLVFSVTRSLDVIDAACAADSVCRGYLADGSVRSTLERVMEELDAEPIIVSLTANEIGFEEPVDLVLDGRRTAELSFLLMYHESLIRHLPAVVGGLDDRDPASARWLARTGVRLVIAGQASNDEGTYFAVQCHDRLPFTDGPGDAAVFATAVVPSGLAEGCGEWDRPAAGPEVDDAVTSTVPALLLSGQFDPITPPVYAAEAAARLDHATVVEQDGRGHGIWYGNDCIAQLVQLFVSDPARELDTTCADTAVPVEWARP